VVGVAMFPLLVITESCFEVYGSIYSALLLCQIPHYSPYHVSSDEPKCMDICVSYFELHSFVYEKVQRPLFYVI
jgi:hypothetical protein